MKEYRCTSCEETFTDIEDEDCVVTHLFKEDGTECNSIGELVGSWADAGRPRRANGFDSRGHYDGSYEP